MMFLFVFRLSVRRIGKALRTEKCVHVEEGVREVRAKCVLPRPQGVSAHGLTPSGFI